jgi:hypothetical protein
MLIRFGGVFAIVSVIFWLWAIFDSLTADGSRIRSLPKWAWVVLVLLFLEFGALAWVLFGRPRAARTGGAGRGPGSPSGWNSGGALTRRPNGQRPTGQRATGRPVGPDDDPDFLRGLSKP